VPGWCDRILWHSQQDLREELAPERVPLESINPYGAFRHLVTEPLPTAAGHSSDLVDHYYVRNSVVGPTFLRCRTSIFFYFEK
jgi:hypothetical protein